MRGELITYEKPNSSMTETFRTLRTNIQYSKKNSDKEIKSILVTSFESGEGKSWVASNLAISFSQKGDNVILVDADLRKGRLHKIFETVSKKGMSDMLSLKTNQEIQLVDFVKDTIMDNLKLIPKGERVNNPSELLLNKKIDEFLNITNKIANITIIDSPPVSAVADTMVLASKVDGVILVVEQGKRKAGEIKKMVKDIKKVGGNIIGIVFNKVPNNRRTYGYYSYEYSELPTEVPKSRMK